MAKQAVEGRVVSTGASPEKHILQGAENDVTSAKFAVGRAQKAFDDMKENLVIKERSLKKAEDRLASLRK